MSTTETAVELFKGVPDVTQVKIDSVKGWLNVSKWLSENSLNPDFKSYYHGYSTALTDTLTLLYTNPEVEKIVSPKSHRTFTRVFIYGMVLAVGVTVLSERKENKVWPFEDKKKGVDDSVRDDRE